MKKVITLIICTIISSALLAQTEHLKFKGVPIDGTLEKFSDALIAIGFELNEDSEEDEMFLIGDFAGYKDCRVYVSTLDNINLVNHVSVSFPERDSWSTLLQDYTSLKEMLTDLNNIDKEAVSRISSIVTSLKKFVRLDEAELQEADINKELDLTLELIRHETKNRIKIIKNYGEIPVIKCFPNMLNQVFTNILINACQAIKGEGTITITTEFKDKNLIVKIKDTGCGIPQNQLDKIFSAGFTTKSAGVGTGLGLAICTKIIEKHNGKIIVNSDVGKGSEFIITICSE